MKEGTGVDVRKESQEDGIERRRWGTRMFTEATTNTVIRKRRNTGDVFDDDKDVFDDDKDVFDDDKDVLFLLMSAGEVIGNVSIAKNRICQAVAQSRSSTIGRAQICLI